MINFVSTTERYSQRMLHKSYHHNKKVMQFLPKPCASKYEKKILSDFQLQITFALKFVCNCEFNDTQFSMNYYKISYYTETKGNIISLLYHSKPKKDISITS